LPEGQPEQGPTAKQRADVPTADIAVSVGNAALEAGSSLKALYTCEGSNESPPLEWQGVPSGTAELVLFVMNLQPVNGKLYFDWAVGGIEPSETGLKPGKLPQGAVVGKNSEGKSEYSICPQGPGAESYVFALYALPESISPRAGFDARVLREEVTHEAPNVGLYSVGYGN
jgi:phosphatidylethanolamine-binding protein (PEBP) family uncharacterized protein